MKFPSIIPVLVCLLLAFSGEAQENWIIKKDKNGITVFTRKTKNFKVDEIKVECEFEGSVSQLVGVLFDFGKHPDWVYKTVTSQFINKISDNDVIFYTVIEAPWPFQNRDLIVHMHLQQNTINKVLTIEANNINDLIPENKHLVRVKYSRANWIVTPLKNNKIRIEYRVQIDPGDGVPAWILNLFISNGPFETFTKLKEELRLPQYMQSRFSFIAD